MIPNICSRRDYSENFQKIYTFLKINAVSEIWLEKIAVWNSYCPIHWPIRGSNSGRCAPDTLPLLSREGIRSDIFRWGLLNFPTHWSLTGSFTCNSATATLHIPVQLSYSVCVTQQIARLYFNLKQFQNKEDSRRSSTLHQRRFSGRESRLREVKAHTILWLKGAQVHRLSFRISFWAQIEHCFNSPLSAFPELILGFPCSNQSIWILWIKVFEAFETFNAKSSVLFRAFWLKLFWLQFCPIRIQV